VAKNRQVIIDAQGNHREEIPLARKALMQREEGRRKILLPSSPRFLAKDLDQGLQSPTEGIQWLGVTGGNNPPDTPPFCLPSSALCLLQILL
jgi:hypothetical protein